MGENSGMAELPAIVPAEIPQPPAPMPPSAMELWEQAGGGTPEFNQKRYRDLLREHGHLLSPGDDAYDRAERDLPCGWPRGSRYADEGGTPP